MLLPVFLAAPLAGTEPPTTLDGRPEDPFARQAGTHAVVLVFMGVDCPISNRLAPEIERLHREFSGEGVRFRAIYVSEDAEAVRRHQREFALTLPALLYRGDGLVRSTGIRVTPEAVVYLLSPDNGETRLVYRGRINDLYSGLGRGRPAPTRHDLREVLAAVAARQPVEPRFTEAVGCHVGR
jgi:thiol-disulfide isomerase/thioredoxin